MANQENDPIKDALISQELQRAATAAVTEPAQSTTTITSDKADKTGKAAKAAIYAKIEAAVASKPADAKEFGKTLFDLVIAELLAAVKANGYIRFNDGNGALEYKKLTDVVRKMPKTGEVRTFPVSHRIHSVMGTATKRMLTGEVVEVAATPVVAAATTEVAAVVEVAPAAETAPAEVLDLE